MVLSDCYSWDNEQFGHARLGDPRRTRRLVSLASSLAQHAGLSIVKSSHSTAQVESAYRLIRNPSVSPEAIAEAGFTATARACEAHPLLLALEDTTTNPKTRGLLAHSVLMYAPDSTLPVGLIEQQRWSRATDTYGVKHQRKERPCEEKESYRWQQASERMAERLGEIQKR
ncbi:TPA: IS4 family transposase, partial [Escherichia coli]|nr:IS4 family transposase [Escherichia coli]